MGFGGFADATGLSRGMSNLMGMEPVGYRRYGLAVWVALLIIGNVCTLYGQPGFGPPEIVDQSYEGSSFSIFSTVYAADLDNDGLVDILVSYSSDTGRLSWYRNEGDGIFGAEQLIDTIGFVYYGLNTADLNGDGYQDVLLASYSDSIIEWYPNNANGSFGPSQIIVDGAVYPIVAYSADFDNDGDMDVPAVAQEDGTFFWLENEGDGNLLRRHIIDSLYACYDLKAGDFDDDGDLDIMASLYKGNIFFGEIELAIAWYRNEGGGDFSKQQVLSTGYCYSNLPFSVCFPNIFLTDIDLDSDGDIDFLMNDGVGISSLEEPFWFENYGSGSFSELQELTSDFSWNGPLRVTDLDGDGDADIICRSDSTEYLDWVENLGSLRFVRHSLISNWGLTAFSHHFADFDGDSLTDILSGNFPDAQVVWHKNSINDSTAPQLECHESVNFYLDEDGLAVILASEVAVEISENSGYYLTAMSVDTIGCFDEVPDSVELIVFDYNGNSVVCSAALTVSDTIPPTAICRDLTINSTSPQFFISSIDPTIYSWGDNCDIYATSLNPSQLIAYAGDNPVVLEVTDGSGNLSTCTMNIFLNVLTAIHGHTENVHLSIFPNPMTTVSRLALDAPGVAECEVRLYNPLGQVVRQYSLSPGTDLRISREDLSAGIYSVVIWESKDGAVLAVERLAVR